jgi:heparan-alpha-glucosaminide N-acetyltransferase
MNTVIRAGWSIGFITGRNFYDRHPVTKPGEKELSWEDNLVIMIPSSRRLASIDTYRAIIMFLMIFVNDLVLDKGVPLWLEHAGEMEDRLGLADIVFPAFLFIVGLSIPFAIGSRIARGFTQRSTLLHIFRRGFALLAMGIFQVNYEEYNNVDGLIPKYWWLLLITIGFFLVWLDYPADLSKAKKRWLQGGGIGLLLVMALVYKGGTPESPEWMEPHWYGILGLIGWSYLLCAVLYLFVRDRLAILSILFFFFAGLCIADHAGWLTFLSPIRHYVWIVSSGALPAMTMAGVVSAVFYRRWAEKGKTEQSLAVLVVLALVLLGAGFGLRPMGGISKIRATPSWVLICTAISIGCWIGLAILVDLKGRERWFAALRPAGSSTLTSYLLTYLHFAILQILGFHLPDILRIGGAGIGKSLVFAFLIVLLTGALEKKKIRLSL